MVGASDCGLIPVIAPHDPRTQLSRALHILRTCQRVVTFELQRAVAGARHTNAAEVLFGCMPASAPHITNLSPQQRRRASRPGDDQLISRPRRRHVQKRPFTQDGILKVTARETLQREGERDRAI